MRSRQHQSQIQPRSLVRAALLALVLIGVWASADPARSEEPIDNAWTLCRDGIAAAERLHDLPPHLLSAIAQTESGRWHPERSETLAWPWTVMAEGKGRFLPSKQAAIELVQALRARGVQNIDVGCLQVNLRYHPEAFTDLEQAFDPHRNATYAAGFLAELRQETRSWTRAIGHYHSRQALRGNAYRAKVYKAWRAERHRANRARQAALQAARQAARQATPTKPQG